MFNSWREDPKFRSSDSASIATTSVGGTDQINLWQHFFDPGAAQGFHVENTPVEYALSGDVDPGVVGLGSASTLMQSLVDQKLISAKTFSLYIGNGMERAGPGHINGSNIFGGYDSSRMTGEVHTYNMDFSQPDCLPVTIADIVIDDPDHDIRNRSIIDNGKSFQARITTDQYPMLLPQQVTQNFKNLLGAGKSGNADNSLKIMQPFSGIMRIKLSDGFEVTLPTETVFNTSGISPVQDNTDANYTGPFYLSTAWLSQVYLTLDYDTSKFHIAQVVQQADNIIPMPLCVNATPVPYERHPKPSQFAQAGLAGAIVGGFIGGIAIGVALLVIVLSRKRNRLSHEQQGRFHRFSKSGSDDTEMESLTPVGGGANTPWARAGLPNTSYKDVDPRDEDMEIWGNGTASFVILHE